MIIYPAYLNSELSRREGRRIARKLAVSNPSAEEILKALHRLGVRDARIERHAAYPRRWWSGKGRVVLERKGGKTGLMLQVAEELRRMRSPS